MANPSPSPCNLPEEELPDRIAAIRREILPHVKRTTQRAGEVSWEFDWSAALEAKLERFVAFERQCCGSLEFELRSEQERESRGLRLRVAGEGAEAFAALLERDERRVRRLATAGGLGVGIAFFVCCVLPVAAAAVVGAAVAAPLASLDQPAVIAASAIVAGGAAWLLMRRREARGKATASCGPDC
jgi:hypothetical protein